MEENDVIVDGRHEAPQGSQSQEEAERAAPAEGEAALEKEQQAVGDESGTSEAEQDSTQQDETAPGQPTSRPPEQPAADVGPANEVLDAISGLSVQLDGLTEQFKKRIAKSDHEDEMLKRYSDEIQECRSDLYRKITLPILRDLIRIRDMIGGALERASAKDPENPSVPSEDLEVYRDMIETMLDSYGVETRVPAAGDDLIPKLERAVGKVKTGDKALHGKLAAVMNDGYVMDGKCISPSKVKVYVYDESLAERDVTQGDGACVGEVQEGDDATATQ